MQISSIIIIGASVSDQHVMLTMLCNTYKITMIQLDFVGSNSDTEAHERQPRRLCLVSRTSRMTLINGIPCNIEASERQRKDAKNKEKPKMMKNVYYMHA